jgi:hypothetical protein
MSAHPGANTEERIAMMRIRRQVFAPVAVLCVLIGVLALAAGSALADASPAVTINAPTNVSYTTAHVSGTVNPHDSSSPVNWHFEYSTEPSNESAWNYAPTANGEIAGTEAEGTTPITVEGNLESFEELPGLAPGTEYAVRLVAENELGANRVVTQEPYPTLKTKPVALPSASIAAPSAVTGTSAHFSGEINPNAPSGNPSAFDVNWRFECTPECPGLSGGTIPADNSTHTVEVDATGLLYNTSYEVKLIAENTGGQVSQTQTFKTKATAPIAESRTVGTFTDTTAIIGGSVNPNGSLTTYTIEYADNPAFVNQTSVPATQNTSVGSGQTPVMVSQLISGLEPSSTYYFRIIAANPVGTSLSAAQSFQTRTTETGPTCTNEELRVENNSLELPDCRAYELVTPDLNHALLGTEQEGLATEDGDTLVYGAFDAPQHAKSAQALTNRIRSTRDPASGWNGLSFSPSLIGPVDAYSSVQSQGLSADLSSEFLISDQPLTGEIDPHGENAFVSRPDGTYRLLTPLGEPYVGQLDAGNADFSRVYFQPSAPQLPEDPTSGGNTYLWSEEKGLQLIGVLPNGTLAPNGASLAGSIIGAISTDASRAVFTVEGKLYLHIEGAPSVEVSTSRRTVNPDPNPLPGLAYIAEYDPVISAGITNNGSTVLFAAHGELTNSANTGETSGVANDAGTDLYSYDVASGKLTDLTVDTDPVDAATGANVRSVLGVSPDGSYIYFTATGDLASGAVPGHTSLYVWHAGEIKFVADADGLHASGPLPRTYVTPNGLHFAFGSTENLTGYDNVDAVTGQPDSEVFEANFGAGIECVSCHPNGARPTADSYLPPNGFIGGSQRVVSDDGSRVFFESYDSVVPQASNGLQKVYEYSHGAVALISRPDSSSDAYFFDASASGNDVFFKTNDELVPNPNGGDDAIYDARVGGGFHVNSRQECSGAACRGPLTAAPVFGVPASRLLSGAGNIGPAGSGQSVKTKTAAQVRAAKLAKALKGCKVKRNKKKRSMCERRARHAYGRNK